MFFSLIGCTESVPSLENKITDNPTANVNVLFNIDGCTVYRFYDHGDYVYFTKCDPAYKTQTIRVYQECYYSGKVLICNDQKKQVN